MTIKEELAYVRGWEDSLQTLLYILNNVYDVDEVREKILKIAESTKNNKLMKIREIYGEFVKI
ncbi:MAG: hypothetical protein LBC03_05610 [Nitrososphaerota archaeon]|jgi:hypothetical protein|nr:hypothetical protein [Nitrososphaerota archaeon]